MRKKILLSTFAMITVIVGCQKKEQNDVLPAVSSSVKVVKGRLSFSSQSTFEALIKESIEKRKPDLILQNADVKNSIENARFSSLMDNTKLDNARISGSEIENDSLIPDDYFASFMNDEHELQIEENIIKVTEEGTYICNNDKYSRLIEILKTRPTHGNSNVADDLAGDYKTIEDGILFYDSFSTPKPSSKINFQVAESENTSQGSNTRVNFNYLPASVYNSFDTYSFGKHTIVGKWIESVFGSKTNEYVYFNNHERLKLSFFDVSYVVYKSIGIEAETQHKTWIGWGGNLYADELRMGWDGLAYTMSFPYTPSPGIPSVNFGTVKFKDFGVNVASFDYFDGYLSDPLANKIKGVVDGAINEVLSSTLDNLYRLIRQKLGSQSLWEKNYSAEFRMHYPDKLVCLMGRYEELEERSNKMRRIFDWSTPTVGIRVNSKGQIQSPIYNKGTVYDITKGVVYACATNGGKTIGVRIVKD